MNDETATYVPGVCNINKAEVNRRRTIGIAGLLLLVVLFAGMIGFKVPTLFRAILFIPSFLMATGFLQAKNKFCVGYASSGMYHTGEHAQHITEKANIKADKIRAQKMNIQAIGIALLITALLVILPINY